MKEIAIVLSDDMDWAEKRERVPADETVTLALNGSAVELDLTAKHAAELRELLGPWLAAGREPESARKPGPRTGTMNGRKHDPQSVARKKAIRDWVDEYGIRGRGEPDRPAYRSPIGGMTYPKWLYEAYDQHLAGQEHDLILDGR